MSRIADSPLRRIRKVCRVVRYLAYRKFCSSTIFEGIGGDAALACKYGGMQSDAVLGLKEVLQGVGGDAASKTLACKYGAVLQKIGLGCSGFSVSLQNIS